MDIKRKDGAFSVEDNGQEFEVKLANADNLSLNDPVAYCLAHGETCAHAKAVNEARAAGTLEDSDDAEGAVAAAEDEKIVSRLGAEPSALVPGEADKPAAADDAIGEGGAPAVALAESLSKANEQTTSSVADDATEGTADAESVEDQPTGDAAAADAAEAEGMAGGEEAPKAKRSRSK